jgi:Bacterial TSP3 repeat
MTSSPDKLFVRLHYVDDATVLTLQQARDADFDNDGIPNDYEIEIIFSNPLDRNSAGGDTDSDGLPDGWELFHFGGLNIANPSATLKSDGLTNKEKADLGLNPNIDYSSVSAAQPTSYTYDLTGRLTGVTAPVGAGNYTSDEEGNLLNAQ